MEIQKEAKTATANKPLFLTPYLREGRIPEARALARVDLPGIEVESYSGLISLNQAFNSNTFFWLFPAKNGVESSPVVLFLDGGPGVSFFFSTFNQALKLSADGTNLSRQGQYVNWTQGHSVIYVENPVGTGYSFTEDERGYAKTSEEAAEGVYEFLKQIFIIFPELLPRPFYIAGASYGAKYALALASIIFRQDFQINLRSVLLFCPWLDPVNQIPFYGSFFYELGLVDELGRAQVEAETSKMVQSIKAGNLLDARNRWIELIGTQESTFNRLTAFTSYPMNALVDKSKESELSFIDFVQTPEIRSALHVGNLSYDFESASVVEKFELDFMGSMKHLVQDLLNQNIPILMITGQMDTTLPHRGVQNMISKLDWKRRSEYEASERKVWKVEDRVAGFERSGGGLTSVLVRNAGHGLIGDQKVWIVNMLNRITGNKTN